MTWGVGQGLSKLENKTEHPTIIPCGPAGPVGLCCIAHPPGADGNSKEFVEKRLGGLREGVKLLQ
jgi:hypothetical protein